VFSPEGLVGLYERLTRRWRKQPVLDAAMSQRQAGEVTLPAFLKPAQHVEGEYSFEVLEGAGHWLQFERSAEVSLALTTAASK